MSVAMVEVEEVVEVEETRTVISSEEFRKALRHFPAGVTIVTVRAGDKIHGLTVSAFA
jgi:flavin reductase (DIM6/NTAB) family NADH-FMN oxidoreductase RutF